MSDTGSGLFRVCDECGGVDDHPRHSFTGEIPDVHPVNDPVRQVMLDSLATLGKAGKITMEQALRIGADFEDTTSADYHIDCCANRGCPKAGTVDGCDLRVKVWNGKTGTGMVAAAMTVREQNAEHFAPKEEVAS
jgi:hypothetical protein